jgi:hypothetical protein
MSEKTQLLNFMPIYKINHLIDDNVIDTIYVFYGKNPSIKNINELFKNDPSNHAFINIFNSEELTNITKNNIRVHFSEQQIHMDDTIGIIKIKILTELRKEYSLEEIYLFCLKEEILNTNVIYQSLTQNKKLDLTRIRINQFLINLVRDDTGNPVKLTIPDKKIYSYDDILSLNINNKKMWVSKVLGQKYFIVENEYPFVYNPFDVTEYDTFFEKASQKSLSTLNNQLLLNTGEIVGNNIYLCFAMDVLKKNVSQEYTLRIYYPFLYSKNIKSLNDLMEKQPGLIEENKKIINNSTLETLKNVDMFYDVYKYKNSDLNYKFSGIKSIKLIIRPEFNVKVPLDIIFKLIHATKDIPLIKYNPALKQENIYRLYTDKMSQDGRKIPYLHKSNIIKLIKTIGSTKSVTAFIEYTKDDTKYQIICEIDENCNIIISTELYDSMDVNDIDTLLRETANPVINEIKDYMEQSGYKIRLFNSLMDTFIDIKQINYQSKLEINKPIKIDKLIGCISSAFIIENDNFKKGIILRFKRVSNFNKRTSQEAFIIEKQKEGLVGLEIVEELVKNYNINQNDALDIVKGLLNEEEIERGTKKNQIEIKDNPGFKTIIEFDKFTSVITINVYNINNIYYLYTIPIFLDTLIRITQDKTTTLYPISDINKLCSSGEKKDIKLDDIVSVYDKNVDEYEIPYIENNELEFKIPSEASVDDYNEDIDNKRDIGLFLDEMSDEELEELDEDDDDFEGGRVKRHKDDDSDNSLEKVDSLRNFEEELEELYEDGGDFEGGRVKSHKATSDDSDNSLETVDSLRNVEEELEELYEDGGEFEGGQVKSPKTASDDDSDKTLESLSDSLTKSDEPKNNIDMKESKLGEVDADNYIKNIDGMPLNNPYFFQDRIKKRDPTLIITQKQGNFNAYSRICPSSTRRQPVILNESEKQNIEKNYKGFLKEEDIVKYGSTPDKQYYYICPRYWCLKTNSVISEEDVKAGKCGAILPKTAKKVIPGHYVYEFYTPPKNKPNYKHYPGFQDDSHPQGFCLPCCFKTWDTKEQLSRRNKCSGKEKPKEEIPKPKKQLEDMYIKGPEKFPLSSGRWGYLPVSIQKILHEANNDCYTNKNNALIKENRACLLRHGVEISEKQSFIACIADAIFFAKKDENGIPYKIPSIVEMKDRIIKSLKIDNFIKYQNGNLVTNFDKLNENVDITKYKSSNIYLKLNHTDEVEMNYFKKVISAFENFIDFLKNDDIFIDYSYLWDIICSLNALIFPSGINLIVLQISNNDITNNVELICPTNQYSNSLYESRKPSLILIREGDYFEPVYSYKNNTKRILIGKTFSEYDPNLSKTLLAVLKKIIKPYIRNKCIPLASMQRQYMAKSPIKLFDLIQILNKKKYDIIKQVVNYNSKVIGVIAKSKLNKRTSGFIPCYPSAINDTINEYVYMTDDNLWNNYENTIEFLIKLSGKNSTIPCKPAYKVIEDEHIVGILTETNQFIQLSEPKLLLDVRDDIPVLDNENYTVTTNNKIKFTDVDITTSTDKDKERINYIKKIKLETNFYNVFRNTVRILINDYENLPIRANIETELNKSYMIYSEKLKIVDKLLRKLVKNKIEFTGDANYYKKIEQVTTCILKNTEKCSLQKKICMVSENDECVLILPKRNLITNNENEYIYYIKLTDELIRYNRINSFIFKPQSYLSFETIDYNLNENEILMIQSLLTQEYFEGLIPAVINNYAKYNTFDQAEPLKKQAYDNLVELNEAINPNNIKECNTKTTHKIKSSIWRKAFPSNYLEVEYLKSNYCTFFFLTELIQKAINLELTINDIRKALLEEYSTYLKSYKDKVLDILIFEGKKTLGDQVKAGVLPFEQFILSDSYFITNLDLWVILNKYKIPSFLISTKYLTETNYNRQSFLCYGKEGDSFIFIVSPGLRAENIPLYKYIEDETQNIVIPIDKLKNSECISDLNKSIHKQITIEEYLKAYTKYLTTNYTRKIPIKQVEDEPQHISKTKKNIKRKTPKMKNKKNVSQTKADIILQQKLDEQLLNVDEQNIKQTKKQKARDFFDKKLKTRKTRKKNENVERVEKVEEEPMNN